ncbi:PfkB family carbohydrate kinase [Paraburkholderia sp. SOS3]|uniref:PfkB family carbohydrate kinase n=1 Tax=Paraburkholderia sp. SOS3 TaxID=1926494 RepID=UPI0009477C73|nr:PfkB family carbohydrate kinase [Paraburkholderia sp. SOS3]APR37441.1 hypothetical protein BTO02_05330 [Paraburkholderia sp. SOS3]
MSADIAVIGGSYGEECAFPRRQVFRGSGTRAAVALATMGAKVRLHTVLGTALEAEFRAIADKFCYELAATTTSDDIWFRYRYPMGRPELYPSRVLKPVVHETVRADCALVFGMVEGRPQTHANRVVYDPQDGDGSIDYIANGSTANELAMVVSLSEGRALTGHNEADCILAALLKLSGVSAAVIKCGPQGALAGTLNARIWIPSVPTTNVYKIGSGDIFSAAFAFAWMADNAPAIEAAKFASLATARYVETATDSFNSGVRSDLKIHASFLAENGQQAERAVPKGRIYLASPFFNTAQQWMVDEVREALRDMGFNVFSPIHDVGEGLVEDIVERDLQALDRSEIVIALLDGLDPGTIFEVGYARARAIPVVIIAESVSENALTMMIGSGCYVTSDLTTGIYAVCWKLMGDV